MSNSVLNEGCIKILKEKELLYIRKKIPYEKYQIDLVGLSNGLNMKGKYPYLLTWVNDFSKYEWAIPFENKKQKQFEILCIRYLLEAILKKI